jgi:all-trans-retinol dehydrogenase (NAD+)
MKDLKNKKVLITGGARGIGKQIALEFARQGADIIICDSDKSFFNKTEFKKNRKEIEDIGASCYGFYLDVTKYEDIIRERRSILDLVGKIDVLVNNAGVVFGGNFLEVPIEKHRLTYDVNTYGIINMLHVFLQDLIDQPTAHIVNISSASGFVPLPGGSTYASSKAAVTSLSESLNIELKREGNQHVGMTIVCPGYVQTGMFDGVKGPILVPILTPEKLAKKIVKAVQKNKRFVLEPTFINFLPFIKGVFPQFVLDLFGHAMGVNRSMDLWKGHSKS